MISKALFLDYLKVILPLVQEMNKMVFYGWACSTEFTVVKNIDILYSVT